MVTIVTRTGKGSPLTNSEVDANFTNLKSAVETSQSDITDLESTYATQEFAKRVAKKAAIKFGS